GKNDFHGWVDGSDPNWRGIAGSVFKVGFDALGPELPGLTIGRFNFGLGGFVNSALNPSTGRTAAVGLFEYGYGSVANSVASMGYKWIREQLGAPSGPARVTGQRV